jgi:iron(III) transport system permease protein
MSQTFARAVFAITALFFGAFFFWPLLEILRGGFVDADGHFTLGYLTALLCSPPHLIGLRNALGVACATTALALVIAVPLAWIHDRCAFPGKSWLSGAILVPLILPPFVGAIGLKQIFGQYGACNALFHQLHLLGPAATIDWLAHGRFWGVVAIEALSLYPIIYLNAVAALSAVDPAVEEAASNLGAAPWRTFVRVTLPLIRPSLFAGGTLVFIWSFTELGTPLIFDYDRIASVQIYEGLKELGGNPVPFALVSLMLAASLGCYALGKGVFGRSPINTSGASPRPRTATILSRRARVVCTVLFAGVASAAVLPHLSVVLVAFSRDWYGSVLPHAWTLDNARAALGHELTAPSIANSLRFAGAATIVDLLFGVAIGYVIARSRLASRHVLDAMTMLPLAVPGLVLAFGYVAMAQEGRAFAFLNPTQNPTALLIIAYSVRRLPYVVRSAAAGFQQSSVALEEAAQNLGASPAKAALRITLPLVRPGIFAGALLAFAFAVLEVSDSLILAQKQVYYPVTKALLEFVQLLGDGRFLASALAVWAMAFLATILAATAVLSRRSVATLFSTTTR